ncbi:hypothetical protein [Nocardia pseudovaccinii]|uniref:hypothetical protein n=1 Tax=Nocardia pseudovaccinii TaxID=189540 RepID=UPI0007A48455|nr:hypothetical protein [Nocardia pseudovaccinii]
MPELAVDLSAEATSLTWIGDAYIGAPTALVLPIGALGDKFGRNILLVRTIVKTNPPALDLSPPDNAPAVRSSAAAGPAGCNTGRTSVAVLAGAAESAEPTYSSRPCPAIPVTAAVPSSTATALLGFVLPVVNNIGDISHELACVGAHSGISGSWLVRGTDPSSSTPEENDDNYDTNETLGESRSRECCTSHRWLQWWFEYRQCRRHLEHSNLPAGVQ